MKERKKQWFALYAIVVLSFVAFIISFPRVHVRFNIFSWRYYQELAGPDVDFTVFGKEFYKELNFDYGLYLGGGTRWTFDVDLESVPEEGRVSTFQKVQDQISERMDVLGVENVDVEFVQDETYQVSFDFVEDQVNVQDLMMVTRRNEVDFKELKEEFRDTDDQEVLSDPLSYVATELTDAELQGASVLTNPTTSEPVIKLHLSDTGKQMFYEISKRNGGLPIAIMIDDQIIAAPRVSADLAEGDIGDPVISGGYTEETAKLLETVFDVGSLVAPANFSNIEEVESAITTTTLKNLGWILFAGIFTTFVLVATRYGLLGSFVKLATVLFPLFYIAIIKLGIPSVFVWALTGKMAETVFVNLPITVGGVVGFVLSFTLAFLLKLIIIDNIKTSAGEKKINIEMIESAYERVLPSVKKLFGLMIVISFVIGQFGPSMLGDVAIAMVLGLIVGLFTTYVVLRNLLVLSAVRLKTKDMFWNRWFSSLPLSLTTSKPNNIKPISLVLCCALAVSAVILWIPKWDVNTQFLVQTLCASGLTIFTIIVYLAMTHGDKSKTANPWSSAISIITSLLFDLLLMFGAISALGHLVGLEINNVFILTLCAISIYLLVEKVIFKNFKLSLFVMLPLSVLVLVGETSYKWHALVLLVGLMSNFTWGDYVANSTSTCLQKFRKLFERKKKAKKKKGKKRRKVRRKKKGEKK